MSRTARELNFRHVDKLLKLSGNRGVQVGFLNGATYHNRPEITVAQVALWNEMGQNNGPKRPFMRTAFKGQANHIALIKKVGRQVINGERSMDSALDVVGARAKRVLEDEIRKYAERGGNTASTIKRKGRDSPLRDTDLMLNNIDYEKI